VKLDPDQPTDAETERPLVFRAFRIIQVLQFEQECSVRNLGQQNLGVPVNHLLQLGIILHEILEKHVLPGEDADGDVILHVKDN
jgi:hypothetical protein